MSTLPEKIVLKDSSCIKSLRMWSEEEWCIEEDDNDDIYLNFYIPTDFDVDKAFGLHFLPDESDDYINVYLNWYPKTNEVKLMVCCTTLDEDRTYDVEMSQEQKSELKKVLPKICKAAYGYTPRELLKREQEDDDF